MQFLFFSASLELIFSSIFYSVNIVNYIDFVIRTLSIRCILLYKLLSMQYSIVTNRHSVFFFNVQIPISSTTTQNSPLCPFPPPPFNWGIIDKAKMYVFKMHTTWFDIHIHCVMITYQTISSWLNIIIMDSRSTYERCFLWFFLLPSHCLCGICTVRFKLWLDGNCYVFLLSLFPYLNLYITAPGNTRASLSQLNW